MTEKEKIKMYLENQGISKNKFYQVTGLGIGFLDSGKSLGVDKLKIIINKYPNLSLRWIVMDEGEMIATEAPAQRPGDESWMKEVIQNQAAALNRLSAKIEQLEKERGMLVKGDAHSAHSGAVNP